MSIPLLSSYQPGLTLRGLLDANIKHPSGILPVFRLTRKCVPNVCEVLWESQEKSEQAAHLFEDAGDLSVWLADLRQGGGASQGGGAFRGGQADLPRPVVDVAELPQQRQVVVVVGILQA